MRRSDSQSRGAVLIMTMMAICLTFMMIYALVQTSGIGLNTAGSFYDREAALTAAQSGLDYAVTQMQVNRDWKGDSNRKYWHNSGSEYKNVDNNNFQVIESNGNVIGLLTNKAGYKSAFRIKFNYEFTSKDIDEGIFKYAPCSSFADSDSSEPKPSISIDMPYVSINNFAGAKETLMYRAKDDGQGFSKDTYNLELGGKDDNLKRAYANHVPPQRICIIVEGLAGNGLRNCTAPEQIVKDAVKENYDSNRVVKRYVEAYYNFNAPILKGYAAYAKGGLTATVPNNMLVKSVGYQSSEYKIPAPGSIYSRGKIKITGKLCTHNGTVDSPYTPEFQTDDTKYKYKRFSGNWFTHLFGKDYKEVVFPRAPTEIVSAKDTSKDYHISDSQLANASNSSGNQLRSGLYEWHLTNDSTETDKAYELRYYSTFTIDEATGRPVVSSSDKYNYELITATEPADNDKTVVIKDAAGNDVTINKSPLIANAPKGKVSLGLGSDTNKITSPVLKLAGEVYCSGTLAVSADLTSVNGVCPVVNVDTYTPINSSGQPDYHNKVDGVLLTAGDMTLLASIKGNGAIVAKDSTGPRDIKLIGESALKSNSTGIAVYGKDISLMSLEMATTTPLNTQSTGSGSGSRPYNNDSISITWQELEKLYTDCRLSSSPDSPTFDLQKAKDTLTDYFAKQYATIEVMDGCQEGAGFRFKFKYVQTANTNNNSSEEHGKEYIIHFDPTNSESQIQVEDPSLTPSIFMCAEYTHQIPQDSYVPPADTPPPSDDDAIDDTVNEDGTYSRPEEYANVCYGDQVFNGVICATNNFKAELSGYKLIVNGAIRAEGTGESGGMMTLNCDSVDLTYDEEAVSKLLPRYCSLNCELWNCW